MGCLACALARRGDRRSHDPALGEGSRLATTRTPSPPRPLLVIVARALQAERRLTSGDSLRVASILTVTAIVVAGASQHTVAAGEFENLWDGIWWAVVTVTTVGYGDLYPKSVGGRLVGMALMFVGIGFLSLLTAAVASRFVKEERGDEHAEVIETLRRIEADVAELKSRMR